MIATAEHTLQPLPDISSTAAVQLPGVGRFGERRLLTKAQVAARMGCSERSVERLVKQGQFPAPRRYGRGVVWFEAAVEHVLGLAEQEQLHWHPDAMLAVGEGIANSAHAAIPPMPSLIPDARELEPEVMPQAARKARKAAASTKRRPPSGVSAEDLEGMRLLFHVPPV